MKEILISIKPQWVAKILNGEKTLEIRKTKPKCELPVKVYIYCTKAIEFKGINLYELKKVNDKYELGLHGDNTINGKVVAEFTLNKVEEHKFNYIFENPETSEEELTYNFTTQEMKNAGFDLGWELDEFLYYYGKEKTLYAWHIEDLVIYDTPKELSEFGPTRAPQSWQYVKGGL